MTRAIAFAAAMAFALAAAAQQYKWVDKDGKVRYGDTPPPGVKATPLKAPPPGSAAPAAAKPGKDAKAKGPLTPADQEAAFRKRQLDAEKEREEQAKKGQEAQAAQENCQRAREAVAAIEGGQRLSRVDAKGERVFLGDDERAGELAKARKGVSDWCK